MKKPRGCAGDGQKATSASCAAGRRGLRWPGRRLLCFAGCLLAAAACTGGAGQAETHGRGSAPWAMATGREHPAFAGSFLSCGMALALRGGCRVDAQDEAESDAADAADFGDVVLLVFDEGAIMWREGGRGLLQLHNLMSGEPQLTFAPLPRPTAPGDEAEPGAASSPGDVTPILSHVLWELLDFHPLTSGSSSFSIAYELPAEHVVSAAASLPEHGSMVGWRFANANDFQRFEQELLVAKARLRCQGRRHLSPQSDDIVTAVAAGVDGARRRRHLRKPMCWSATREHGLSGQYLEDMLHMEMTPKVFDESEAVGDDGSTEETSSHAGIVRPAPARGHGQASANVGEDSWEGFWANGEDGAGEHSELSGEVSGEGGGARGGPGFPLVSGMLEDQDCSGQQVRMDGAGGLQAAALERLSQILAQKTQGGTQKQQQQQQQQQQDGLVKPVSPVPLHRSEDSGCMGLRGGGVQSVGDASQAAEASGERRDRPYLITTAIAYTNGQPHIGHAYEAATSDIIARHHRLLERKVFFLTGSDEHGQKIAAAAEAAAETPQLMCNRIVASFEKLYSQLNVSYDGFIRTSSEPHKAVAQAVFRRARAAGDIYLGNYSGWYNVRLESFVPEMEAEQANYSDPVTGAPLQRVEEESYFFRLSKYQQRLKAHIEAHEEFVQPLAARNEILQRLEEPLRDLSVSRTSFEWGVAVPDDESGKHVMYVWFDALTNYLSGSCNQLAAAAAGAAAHVDGAAWPAALQVVGKDIVWFHAVIWPAMLWSIGEQPPQRMFAHGFVTDGDGRKMSKSLGNVVEPLGLLRRYGADAVRYSLVCTAPWGHDVPFSESSLVSLHNTVLADGLGNLVHRALSLCHRFSGGVVPEVAAQSAQEAGPICVEELVRETTEAFEALALLRAAQVAERAVRQTNKYLTDSAPWKPEAEAQRACIIRTVLEALYVVAHLFLPFIPKAAERLLGALAHPATALHRLRLEPLACLTPGTRIAGTAPSSSAPAPFEVLFKRLAAPDDDVPAGVANVAACPLDLRAARVVGVETAPGSQDLQLVTVDLDEQGEERRQVVARLPHEVVSGMVGKVVVVLVNVAPAKICGFESKAMLLVAHQPRPQRKMCVLEVMGAVGQGAAAPDIAEPRAGSRIRPASAGSPWVCAPSCHGGGGDPGSNSPCPRGSTTGSAGGLRSSTYPADSRGVVEDLADFDVAALKKLPLRVQELPEQHGASRGGIVVFDGRALQTEEGLLVGAPGVAGPAARIR